MRSTAKAVSGQALQSVPPKPWPFIFDVTGYKRQGVDDVVDENKYLDAVGLDDL